MIYSGSSIMVTVHVQQGCLMGEQLNTVQGDGQYYSFKGIPFAEPPLGKLRFKAPQPPLPWEGVRNATAHGAQCPHRDIITNELVPGNEDCLFLNVYTPDILPKVLLAVMVFIHGGGFKSDSGDVEYYGPDFLVTHGVVLVTFNYRLDSLGFLCLETKDVPGNAGMKDQIAALRWVKENIAKFGGNPANVTIFGQSAGGASVALHVLSPKAKGLFHRAVSMSGVPSCDWAIPFKPQLRPFILGKDLGIDTNDPNVLLDYLQKLPAIDLIDKSPIVLSFEDHNNNTLKMFAFTPVIEKDLGQDYFMIESPIQAIRSGHINDVDFLIGYVNEENAVLTDSYLKDVLKDYNRYPDVIVPRKLEITCNAEEILHLSKKIHNHYFGGKAISLDTVREFETFANDAYYYYDIHRFVFDLSKIGKHRKYLYKFSCFSNRNVFSKPGLKYGIRGAGHQDDLMYLFDAKTFHLKIEKNTREYDLVQFVTTLFTNFAKYGNPTPDCSMGVIWPEYKRSTKLYANLGDNLTIGANPYAEAMHFWDSVYEDAGRENYYYY